ncbi:MAG: type II secretion system F family protein [Actinomycetota bacterium]|nr:type II secretion system F family protein [Actinomycetota bacterium]
MTSLSAWAVVAGLMLGVGLWCVVAAAPRFRRPRLAYRIAPYLVDVSEHARLISRGRPSGPLPVLALVVSPLTAALQRLSGTFLTSDARVRVLLRQAGVPIGVDAHRSRQLLWLAAGAAAGAAAAFVLPNVSVATVVALGVVCGAAGALLAERLLLRRAKARAARLIEELPEVLEFLALSLAAGEGITNSLLRVSRVAGGELAAEFRDVVTRTSMGEPLADALRSLADDLDLPPLRRFVDQLTGALERGSPLADVLRAQAQDARDEHKRRLLELAGRKEVAMLVPLVFLILPMTVIFAIWPGLLVLQLGV